MILGRWPDYGIIMGAVDPRRRRTNGSRVNRNVIWHHLTTLNGTGRGERTLDQATQLGLSSQFSQLHGDAVAVAMRPLSAVPLFQLSWKTTIHRYANRVWVRVKQGQGAERVAGHRVHDGQRPGHRRAPAPQGWCELGAGRRKFLSDTIRRHNCEAWSAYPMP